MALVPCSACRRHVRSTAEVCPFCERRVGAIRASIPAVLGMAVGLALAGCVDDNAGDDSSPSTLDDAGVETSNAGSTSSTSSSDSIGDDDAGGETYGGAEWETSAGWESTTRSEDSTTSSEESTTGESESSGSSTSGATETLGDDAGGETYGGPAWETGTESGGSGTG